MNSKGKSLTILMAETSLSSLYLFIYFIYFDESQVVFIQWIVVEEG